MVLNFPLPSLLKNSSLRLAGKLQMMKSGGVLQFAMTVRLFILSKLWSWLFCWDVILITINKVATLLKFCQCQCLLYYILMLLVINLVCGS